METPRSFAPVPSPSVKWFSSESTEARHPGEIEDAGVAGQGHSIEEEHLEPAPCPNNLRRGILDLQRWLVTSFLILGGCGYRSGRWCGFQDAAMQTHRCKLEA